MGEQLNLPLVGRVIAFPANRRWREVLAAADLLSRSQGVEAEACWKAAVLAMANPLRAAGVPLEEVRREIGAFHQAVQAELTRVACLAHTHRPGGDAA